ncbi:MAG TPA: hypothetical protein VJN94_00440 [Candidatus Binataceae bacterium]|nr:hypothetical protein [Candidatus Binataceae bacterium]
MKRTSSAIAASALVFGLVIGISGAARAKPKAPQGIPLASLAGNWAGQGHSTFSLCFTSGFASETDCTSAVDIAFYTEADIIQGTGDKSGNGCFTETITNSPEFPNPATPASAFTQIVTTKSTSYNSATGIGESDFKVYNAGSGTLCNGSVLVNTADAPVVGSGTLTGVASQGGNRIDTITDTFVASPISDVDDSVGTGFVLKQ